VHHLWSKLLDPTATTHALAHRTPTTTIHTIHTHTYTHAYTHIHTHVPTGLLVASTQSGAVVHRLALPGGATVWSAAWSRRCDQQLLVGLDHGRLGLVDLRMTGREHKGLVVLSAGEGVVGRQPLLRVAPLPGALAGGRGGGCDDGGGGGANACVVATPGGVYGWSEGGGGLFEPLLEAQGLGGGSCESVALTDSGGAPLLCASFRSKLAAAPSQQPPRPAAHVLYRLGKLQREEPGEREEAAASGAAGDGGGSGEAAAGASEPQPQHAHQQQQHQQRHAPPAATAELIGHASCRVVTCGAFAHLPSMSGGGGGDALAFFSGDELSNTVAAWDCSSGMGMRRYPWPALEAPVVQVAAAARGGGVGGPLIGALCESQLLLCEWVPDIL